MWRALNLLVVVSYDSGFLLYALTASSVELAEQLLSWRPKQSGELSIVPKPD